MAPSHTLRVLGGLGLYAGDGRAVSGRAGQKRRLALLALLALAPGRVMSRDRLIAFLWPESDADQARHLLSVSLYELRRALGEDALVTRGDDVVLSAADVATDLDTFEEAVRAGELEAAAALFSGPFLDGFHVSDAPELERWVEGERDRLGRSRAALLERLAGARAAAGDAAGAAEAWLRLAALEPYNGRIAMATMVALEAAGNRAAAIRHAHVHATMLREEIGAEPDAAIKTLAERLRSAPPAAAVVPTSAAVAPEAPSAPPADATVGVPEAAPERVSAPGPIGSGPRSRRLALPTALAAVAAAALWLVLAPSRDGSGSEPAAEAVRVAVLPFQDLTAVTPPEFAYFGDGLSDELRHKLLAVGGLQLSSAVSAFTFRGDVNLDDVARTLNVRYVVAGSFRVSGDRIAVIAKLHDARTKTLLWTDYYDEPRDSRRDHIAMQADIAQQIVHALPGQLPLQRQLDPLAALTADMSAAQLYAAGRRLLLLRRIGDMGMALRYFGQAVARDPDFALAHAAIAETHVLLGSYDYGGMEPGAAFEQARASALRALAIDSALAPAHAALGAVHFHYDWQWDTAERAFRRAIEIDPGYAYAHNWYSLLLHTRGRRAEAFRTIEQGTELDVLSLIMKAAVARHYYLAGQLDSAVAHFRRTLALDTTYVSARIGLGMSLAQLGRYDEAIDQYERTTAILGGEPIPLVRGLLGYAHGRAGRRAQAREQLVAIRAVARSTYVPAEYLVLIHVGIGDEPSAVAALRSAFDNRSSGIPYVLIEPMLRPLRGNPEFRRIVSDAGL
jgi:DNA-binding SARP family transcriptional activator/TolB-like protein/Flp pilus assembly protein TadD